MASFRAKATQIRRESLNFWNCTALQDMDVTAPGVIFCMKIGIKWSDVNTIFSILQSAMWNLAFNRL